MLICLLVPELMENDEDLSEDERRHLTESPLTPTPAVSTKTASSAVKKQKQVKRELSSKSSGEAHDEEDGIASVPLLHSGGVLGDLPVLSPSKPTYVTESTVKKKKKKTSNIVVGDMPADIPSEFVCELCHKQMSDPVKSVYGNVFERGVIEKWLSTQGHICPLTGAPLGESDLAPQDDLKIRIRKWILQRSMRSDDAPPLTPQPDVSDDVRVAPGKGRASARSAPAHADEDEGLYDF